MRRLLATGLLAGALVLGALPPAAAADRSDTGPPLSVHPNNLASALVCTAGDPGLAPVLLIPGTTLDPEVNFGWNYEQAFLLERRTFCTVELPDRAMADIQVAAEYVVFGIRSLRARTGQQVSLVGHSQGGMIGRWALKYWPDTRRMVDDVVGMAPSSHGTDVAEWMCNPDCAPAIWQQRTGSAFMAALNAGPETWPGISYTVVYSLTDGILVPAESAMLTTGQGAIANIEVSEACPGRTVDHTGLGTYDPITHALVTDALNNPGPASLTRFDDAVCSEVLQPGVNQAFFGFHYSRALSSIAATVLLTPHVPAEPKLASYAR